MFEARFDHISLHVSDVEKSIQFYCQLLGMELLPRPNFTFKGAWIRMHDHLAIHLIEGKDYETRSGNRGNHFAFSATDVNALEIDFRAKGIEVVSNKIRVDGIRQMFIKDPDGYFIEFNESPIS